MSFEKLNLKGNNQAGDVAGKAAQFGLTLATVGLGFGVTLGLMNGAEDGHTHFWFAYLVAFSFLLTITLGSMFFTVVQHMVNAHWSVTVRRFAELTMANMPMVALFALPLLVPLFSDDVSVWKWATMAHDEHGAVISVEEAGHDAAPVAGLTAEASLAAQGQHAEGGHSKAEELSHAEHFEFTAHKFPFLNRKFFAGRLLLYFLIWIFVARFFFKKSVEQDTASNYDPTLAMKRKAAVAIIVFAFTISFAAFDLLMSLDETWFSTIFGVYIFAGAFLSSVAWMVIQAKFCQKNGLLTEVIHDEHYHDLGKWMFAFTFFWGYIAFSQFMLIWYANLPEETAFYGARLTEGWSAWTWALLVFHLIIPFGGLLSRHVKRNTNILLGWAYYLLIMQFIDLYWIVMPNYHRSEVGFENPFGIMEVSLVMGMFGVLVYGNARRAGKQALLPVGDPLLAKSLRFRNI
ncbi:MAG: hypothetical protein O3A95_06350 [Planctomycetota bacterium]|nr:hypothetical protein [Planctomycetota bacterium]MDA1113903.1 hypothetical protein [Planctomycetota bacterium]